MGYCLAPGWGDWGEDRKYLNYRKGRNDRNDWNYRKNRKYRNDWN